MCCKDAEEFKEEDQDSDNGLLKNKNQKQDFKSVRIRKFEEEQDELMKFRKQWILKQSDPYREKWDYIVMFCAVYNCIYLPYEIAFKAQNDCNTEL